MDSVLRKKHRNDLLELIKAASFDPRRFRPSDLRIETYVSGRSGVDGHQLQLDDSPVAFVIATDFNDERWQFCSMAIDCRLTKKGAEASHGSWSSWTVNFAQIEEAFSKWLQRSATKYFAYLAEKEEDDNTPDLWAELDVSTADLQGLENTPFSSDERTRISKSLNKFLEDVESRDLVSPDELKLLRGRVEYAIESSRRLSRKDWVMATTGALMGFALQAGLTTGVATQILQLAADALNWLWTLPPNPPLLGP